MPASQPLPDAEAEVVDAEILPEPAPAPAGPLAQRSPAASPVVRQAAAVAVTSFVAGAATIAAARLVRRAGVRRRRTRRPAVGHVLASRSFLVDVHVLAPRD